MKFSDELRGLLNRHNIPEETNTPDHIITEYMMSCYNAFFRAMTARRAHYGEDDKSEKEWAELGTKIDLFSFRAGENDQRDFRVKHNLPKEEIHFLFWEWMTEKLPFTVESFCDYLKERKDCTATPVTLIDGDPDDVFMNQISQKLRELKAERAKIIERGIDYRPVYPGPGRFEHQSQYTKEELSPIVTDPTSIPPLGEDESYTKSKGVSPPDDFDSQDNPQGDVLVLAVKGKADKVEQVRILTFANEELAHKAMLNWDTVTTDHWLHDRIIEPKVWYRPDGLGITPIKQ